ncbi:craniofacial development protein 2 [Lasius niger]|uniref:Craniofacial development protein 2 n=1 Tax=Lasius niger TaxID=67767 RepID=A0A0J7K4C7_LASNI|nr:craniofacial development protein 2 [Lasius niger]
MKAVSEFEPVNARLTRLRIRGRFNKISVYALTEDSMEKDKDEFYIKLAKLREKISKHDTLIIAGDFNAKIGKERFTEEVTGKHSLHDETTENDARLCHLAAE